MRFKAFDEVVNNEDNFIKVELQIVPTDTVKDEYDDHKEYSITQMQSIKRDFFLQVKLD